jgi:hydroxysqualene dehydroxylase
VANLDGQLVSGVSDARPTVAVIGGGYAGMAAAVTLAEAGVRCTVFESANTLGGRARRIEYRGEILDNGQHILAGAYTELLRLMHLIGVPEYALRRVPLRLSIPPDFLLSAPRTTLLPPGLYLAWTLFTTKGLAVAEKLGAIRFMRALKRARFQVGASQSVAELLLEHAQPQNLIDNLWQPLTISALNTPMATASAQIFANVLRDSLASTREASDLLLPCIHLSALFPEPAAAWLVRRGGEVRTGTRIRQIVPGVPRFNVISEAGSEQFDGVILAVGPHQLEGLMTGVTDPGLRFEPIVTVYFKFDRGIRLREPMFGQRHGLAQWFFDRACLNFPGDAGASARHDEEALIAAVISASGPHELLSQEELANRVLAELAQHIPDCPTPVWQKVIAEKYATFACTPGAKRPGSTTCHQGVFLAGDYVAGDYPATLEGAVRNGIAAASASINHLRHPPAKSIK